MGRLLRQSLNNKKLSIWKLAVMVVAILMIMEVILNLTIGFGPVISSVLALLAVFMGSVLCFMFIYKDLSKFDYKLIDKELILERALGRANHVVYTISSSDLLSIIAFGKKDKETKIPWLNYLTTGRDKSRWYILSYKKDGDKNQLVIEPDDVFLKGLVEFVENEADNVIIDIDNV